MYVAVLRRPVKLSPAPLGGSGWVGGGWGGVCGAGGVGEGEGKCDCRAALTTMRKL